MNRISLIFFLSIISGTMLAEFQASKKLEKYQTFLQEGTYAGADWTRYKIRPASRYTTFKIAFDQFEKNNGKVIVELGTSHSFVDGKFEGCDSNDTKYWQPNNPAVWDWGAGFFTRVAAEVLSHLNPTIYTVDLDRSAITRCRIMTNDFDTVQYRVMDSVNFLRNCDLVGNIDLLYLDTGYVWPVEGTAQLQLREAQMVVERNLMAPGGIILIDDVRNQTPIKLGGNPNDSKAKYSIPYLLEHGFEMVADEYQVILRKK